MSESECASTGENLIENLNVAWKNLLDAQEETVWFLALRVQFCNWQDDAYTVHSVQLIVETMQ